MATANLSTQRAWAKRVLDRLMPSQLAVPAFLVTWSLLVLLPLIVIVLFSFLQVKSYRVVYNPTLATWQSLIDSGRWIAAVRTLRIGITMTVIELLLAFPFALWLAKGCQSKPMKALVSRRAFT